MRRLMLALSAVFLSTAVALVASHFALSETSKADRTASGGSVSEVYAHAGSAQYATPTRVEPPETDYYSFYDLWLARQVDSPEVPQTGDAVSEG